MFKFAQQLVFGASSEPEQSTASPTLNNKLGGEVRQSRVSIIFKLNFGCITVIFDKEFFCYYQNRNKSIML